MDYNIKILEEHGYHSAMLGLSLSYNKPVHEMKKVADALYNKNKGHNKFLESIQVWLDITMPRYWWGEFDTYRVGVTKQSESTMHTLFKRELTQDDFSWSLNGELLEIINHLITKYNKEKNKGVRNNIFTLIKNYLPEGFLQRRVVCTNYKVLRHIIEQRQNHRLEEWGVFCDYLKNNCKYKEFLN